MNQPLAAIVVLYHPPASLVDNIASYASHVDKIYLISNTGDLKQIELPTYIHQKVIWQLNSENVGMAKALNQGMQMAMSDGYKWVMTMDQDSTFGANMMSYYMLQLQQHVNCQVAMIGPGYGKIVSEKSPTQEVNRLITSGSILRSSAYQQTGPFNESLFIDEVDHEYCYRIREKGYHILKMNDIFMQHHLGEKGSGTISSGRSLHSPIRLYYMVRNGCWIIKKYRKLFPQEIAATRKDIFIRIKNNLLFGKNKMQCLHYILKGYIDYKKHKFGKL